MKQAVHATAVKIEGLDDAAASPLLVGLAGPVSVTEQYTGQVETFVVQATGDYDLMAFGASGGDGYRGGGGGGAELEGEFRLTKGEVLTIVVGGEGGSTKYGAGGGGGGTFIVADGKALLVAGGGGGSGFYSGGYSADPSYSGSGGGGAGGDHGGGGGGGFNGNGGNGVGHGNGGMAFVNGSAGGASSYGDQGGFGGGGAGFNGGGGGGGYTGGYGGQSIYGGGGGGSIDNGVALGTGFNEGNGEVVITEMTCFLAGSRILTERGEVAVEALAAGDRVVTFGGRGAAVKPVVWIGRTSFDARRHPRPDRVWPIRIRRDAFGVGEPARDLLVSPWHGVLVDGVLIPADRLVNGATIVQARDVVRGVYVHVELAEHDILLSEGLRSESYKDNGNRDAFGNAAMFRQLHPEFRPTPADASCVPVVLEGTAARARLILRAGELGYAPLEVTSVHLVTDAGTLVAPESVVDGVHRFRLPGPCRPWLVSDSWVPGEGEADGAREACRLGVKVERIVLDGGRVVAMDDAALADGWYPPERDGDDAWRWTDGRGRLPLVEGSVAVTVVGYPMRWMAADEDTRAVEATRG